MKTYKIKVCGEVQGLGFRKFVFDSAQIFKIFGFVKNEEDGSVCIVVKTGENNLQNFLEHIQKNHGISEPKLIHIYEIDSIDTDSFRILY